MLEYSREELINIIISLSERNVELQLMVSDLQKELERLDDK